MSQGASLTTLSGGCRLLLDFLDLAVETILREPFQARKLAEKESEKLSGSLPTAFATSEHQMACELVEVT